MRLLHEAEVLASAPFGVRLSRAFGRVVVTDTSLGDHSLGYHGPGQMEAVARLRPKFEGFLEQHQRCKHLLSVMEKIFPECNLFLVP